MLGVMNPHLPSGPGVLGSLSRFSFLPNDGWQPTQAGDLLGGNSLLGTPTHLVPPPQLLQAQQQQAQQQQGSLVALQEGTLRLNGGEQSHHGAGQHWQGEVATIASSGGERSGAAAAAVGMAEPSGGELSNAWLLDLLNKQDGAGASPADPQHAYGPGLAASAGLGMVPTSMAAAPQDQTPFAGAPLQPRGLPSAAQQPPFGSMTPYLQQSQHRERQPQPQHQQFFSQLPQARLSPPQQQREQQGGQLQGGEAAAGNGAGLPVGSARPGGAVEQSQKQQQEMWRRGLFSEVFDGGQRAESPFHIPDLGDIEAPDMDDLLMGGLGLDEPFQPLGLPASTPPKPSGLSPPSGRGAFPGSPGQAQQPAPQRPGSSLGLQALQARRGETLESEEAGAGMLSTLRQQGPAASPFMSALPPAPLLELAGRQQAQQEQGEVAADRAAGGGGAAAVRPGQGRGPGKKAVAAKKAAASKRQKAASAAAAKAATAAAKRARLRLEQEAAVATTTTTTLVEWCTEEGPAAEAEMNDPPSWHCKDAALLSLSPAAALVAAGAFPGSFAGGKGVVHPAAAAEATVQHDDVGHHQDIDTCRVTSPAVAAAGKASCGVLQDDAVRGGMRVLGWLFGPQLPKRWSLMDAVGAGR